MSSPTQSLLFLIIRVSFTITIYVIFLETNIKQISWKFLKVQFFSFFSMFETMVFYEGFFLFYFLGFFLLMMVTLKLIEN